MIQCLIMHSIVKRITIIRYFLFYSQSSDYKKKADVRLLRIPSTSKNCFLRFIQLADLATLPIRFQLIASQNCDKDFFEIESDFSHSVCFP
jgi:hypothetical protein